MNKLEIELIKIKKAFQSKEAKNAIKYLFCYCIVSFPLTYLYFNYIFTITLEHINKYTLSKNSDPLLGIFSLMGLCFLFYLCIYKIPFWIADPIAWYFRWTKHQRKKLTLPKGYK